MKVNLLLVNLAIFGSAILGLLVLMGIKVRNKH